MIDEYGSDGITKLFYLRATPPAGLKGDIFDLHWYKQEKSEALIILKYVG